MAEDRMIEDVTVDDSMPGIGADNGKRYEWFIVHTYSGYENKVAENIKSAAEKRDDMREQIVETYVPTETVTELSNEKKKEVVRKLFPGYVLVKVAVAYDEKHSSEESKSGGPELKMSDEAWYLIRNTRGVTGFVGPEGKPLPLKEEDAKKLGIVEDTAQRVTIELEYGIGDLVTVLHGVYSGYCGTVSKIDVENYEVTITISFMGRDTPMILGLNQVELAVK